MTQHRQTTSIRSLTLTPLLDVAFLLLIFFVLTASFNRGEGVLPTELPGSNVATNPIEPPPMPLHVRLASLGGNDVNIQIEGVADTPRNFDELARRLTAMRFDAATNPLGVYAGADPVIIHADGTVHWSHVVNAYNAAMRAEFRQIHFAPAG